MKAELILPIVHQRMMQLGFPNYRVQYIDLQVRAEQQRKLNATNLHYFLVGDVENIRIKSNYGAYDLSNVNAELQIHEHTGPIQLTNMTGQAIAIPFIKVIPGKHQPQTHVTLN